MKPFQVSAPAGEELAAAIAWYEPKRPGLGGEFYDAIVRAGDLIRAHPEIGTVRLLEESALVKPANAPNEPRAVAT